MRGMRIKYGRGLRAARKKFVEENPERAEALRVERVKNYLKKVTKNVSTQDSIGPTADESQQKAEVGRQIQERQRE